MKKQIQYIFFLIISLQLLTSHQKKIELTLSKLDSTSETHLFLDSNEKNMTFIKTSAEFRLQSYSFNLG